ncbi:type II secretion system protein GspE [Microbacterium sp. B35-04]|uniref:GspE/PulE family protein n=1 Tax=unclassified Microbacterium TaxID=2609290 RepID=UPI0013D2A04E|nr:MULTISPECIES: ATPase, T2SS/T4P/T4SS family [unclassified Microbacterium]KAF2411489.1 type II secretion system protein GspE [Microbacterium sp. B35-04]KAF2416381.1 type II secretion system protein GspE [Microbacterium sp. B35-30]
MRGLAQTLVLTGAVRAADVSAAMAEVGDGPELQRALVNARLVTEAQLAEAIALHTGHRYVDLANMPLDPNVVGLVPGNLCRKYGLIPVDLRGERLTVGVLDPTDIVALDDVASITDLFVEPVVVAEDALTQMFERFLRSDEELSELSTSIEESSEANQTAFTESLEEQDDTAPIVRFVNLLIAQAINDRASDIHVEPGEKQLTVRFRIDGVLHEMQKADRAIQDGIISRLKIMSSIDIAEKRKPQDGRLSVTHENRTVDLRVATLPTVWGEKIVMRILDNTGQTMGMRDLLFSPTNEKRFREAITKPHGMILATGPTGSGKSTTLYTALRSIANPKINVITVEDPVEYRIGGINQVQVNNRAGLTFATALRSILRSDPDVVLVGEIRDFETANISIEAALTGHLVLSTLHTNDAPSALTRLTEIGCEPFLVATALSAVIAQRLSRRLCMRCREPLVETSEVLTALGFPHDPADPPQLYQAVGCPACSSTGYRGRVALHEIMTLSDEIETLVVTRATGSEIRQVALEQGMVSLRQDGWSKVTQGLTTIEEVLRVTV